MTLGWASIARIGLVQTALGAPVVLCTATINRVMIVELSLMALVPAALVGMYHAFQLLRPKWGHGADAGRRRSPWIVGGLALLALGTVGAAAGTALAESARLTGLALAAVSFAAVGLGLGAAATNLLAMLAAHVAPQRRAAAGSLVWIMMIAGLAASGITIGQLLDPYSGTRLIQVSLGVGLVSLTVGVLALRGVEPAATERAAGRRRAPFSEAVREVWGDRRARAFAVFVFVAMLAYNTQDLILEPYGGHVFGLTPGQSTALGGTLHAGALAGMLLVFAAGLIAARHGRADALTRLFVVGGCIGSGVCLVALAAGGLAHDWPLTANVVALGFCNGVFAVAAIGAMMGLASEGVQAREGTRMGVFGAAQSVGFAIGASAGAASLDLMRAFIGGLAESYATVFAVEGALFLLAAWLAVQAFGGAPAPAALAVPGE